MRRWCPAASRFSCVSQQPNGRSQSGMRPWNRRSLLCVQNLGRSMHAAPAKGSHSLLTSVLRDAHECVESRVGTLASVTRAGFVSRAAGDMVWSSNFGIPIGTRCMIQTAHGMLGAEGVGCDQSAMMLMAERGLNGVRLGDRVTAAHDTLSAMVGDCLLGRVIDAYGDPIDGPPLADSEIYWPLAGRPINPMKR